MRKVLVLIFGALVIVSISGTSDAFAQSWVAAAAMCTAAKGVLCKANGTAISSTRLPVRGTITNQRDGTSSVSSCSFLQRRSCTNCAMTYTAYPMRCGGAARADAQAIFCRRRHQPIRPPLAKIRPGSPAPAMGPGTACNVALP
jgi:hypothetical protein